MVEIAVENDAGQILGLDRPLANLVRDIGNDRSLQRQLSDVSLDQFHPTLWNGSRRLTWPTKTMRTLVSRSGAGG